MKMNGLFLSAAVASAILSFGSPLHAWEVGVGPATKKILPDTAVPQSKSASIKAARNEWEAFQIVVRSEDGAKNVNVGLTDLAGPEGKTLHASQARLYREHYLDVKSASPMSVTLHERKAGFYPDPLIPFSDPYEVGKNPLGAPFDLASGETGVVFADWYVPAGTPPGEYTGKAVVTADGKAPVEIDVTLEVWEIDLPRTLGTAYGFSDSAVRDFHGGPAPDPAPGYQETLGNYYNALHEHRIDPKTVSGPVTFGFDLDGKLLPVDWAAYDSTVAPWLDGSRFPDGVPVVRFNIGYFRPGSGTGSMTEDQYSQAAAEFARHLKEKGWWDRAYTYATDEPWLDGDDESYTDIKKDFDLLSKYTDLWKGHVLVTSPYDDRIAGAIGIWTPVTPMYENWFYPDGKPGREKYAERLALGEKLWFYVCNANMPPYAGYDIDSAIGYEPRIAKWGAWFERATGFLYWRTTYWVNDDPWNEYRDVAKYGEAGARNGDGFLLYPGDHDGLVGGKGSPAGIEMDGPVVSFRMKQIREGLEDWELFMLASGLGGEDFARKQVSRAYRQFGNFFMEDCSGDVTMYCPKKQPWTLDDAVLLDVREKVAAKTLFLLYPDRYPDPEKQDFDGGTDSGVPPTDGGQPEPAGGCGCAVVWME